jgi:hypothetical protein
MEDNPFHTTQLHQRFHLLNLELLMSQPATKEKNIKGTRHEIDKHHLFQNVNIELFNINMLFF